MRCNAEIHIIAIQVFWKEHHLCMLHVNFMGCGMIWSAGLNGRCPLTAVVSGVECRVQSGVGTGEVDVQS